MRVWTRQDSRYLPQIRSLPPHPEVRENLQRLRRLGSGCSRWRTRPLGGSKHSFRMPTWRITSKNQFLWIPCGQFKPALGVYRSFVAHLKVQPKTIRLAAAHAWDVLGALQAGMVSCLCGTS